MAPGEETPTTTPARAASGTFDGAEIELVAADGHRLAAFSAIPAASNGAGLVVLHEIFGVNAHIREVCAAFAARGFKAVAPALFDRAQRGVELGYDQAAVETGRRLRAAISWDDVLKDVQAAIDWAQAPRGVAIVGYCWGGTLAFLAATRLSGLACAVGYYGAQSMPFVHERTRVPVLLHYGSLDPRIPESDREAMRRHHPEIEMHLFPADHGFNCDHRKEWHAPSAAEALRLTLGFIDRHLGPPAGAAGPSSYPEKQ